MAFRLSQPSFKVGDQIEYARDAKLTGRVVGVYAQDYLVQPAAGKEFLIPKAYSVPFCPPMPQGSTLLPVDPDNTPVPEPWPKNPRVQHWFYRMVNLWKATGNDSPLPQDASTAQFMAFCLFRKWRATGQTAFV